MLRRTVLSMGVAAVLAACAGSGPVALAPESTLIIVRHGDRDGENLNAKGIARAEALVGAVAEFDLAGLYSPGIQRNLDTAAPLAKARNLPVTRVPQENPTGPLTHRGAGRTVIWIGNKGNINTIWEDLSLTAPAPLAYGDLAIIRSDAQGRVSVESRRFGPA